MTKIEKLRRLVRAARAAVGTNAAVKPECCPHGYDWTTRCTGCEAWAEVNDTASRRELMELAKALEPFAEMDVRS